MLQNSTRERWQKLKIDRIALHFLLRTITKIGLVFFQPRYKTLHVHACIVSYWGWKKTSLIFATLHNKKWIFCIKAKLLLLKSCLSEKKIQSDLINFKIFSMPSGGFLKHLELLRQTDYKGKIIKVSMCLKHVQSPRRINFWIFSLSNE